jgi:hypothetical protein
MYGAIFTFAPPLPAMMVIGQSQSLPRTAQGLGHAAGASPLVALRTSAVGRRGEGPLRAAAPRAARKRHEAIGRCEFAHIAQFFTSTNT